VVVGLGDMPWVGRGPWRTVASAPAADGMVVTAAYPGPDGGLRRPPVRIPRARWAELPADGDEGARMLLRARPELVVAVPVDGDPGDVDVRSDLRGPGT
jgi:nicotine blue oxidoreductase